MKRTSEYTEAKLLEFAPEMYEFINRVAQYPGPRNWQAEASAILAAIEKGEGQ